MTTLKLAYCKSKHEVLAGRLDRSKQPPSTEMFALQEDELRDSVAMSLQTC